MYWLSSMTRTVNEWTICSTSFLDRLDVMHGRSCEAAITPPRAYGSVKFTAIFGANGRGLPPGWLRLGQGAAHGIPPALPFGVPCRRRHRRPEAPVELPGGGKIRGLRA